MYGDDIEKGGVRRTLRYSTCMVVIYYLETCRVGGYSGGQAHLAQFVR